VRKHDVIFPHLGKKTRIGRECFLHIGRGGKGEKGKDSFARASIICLKGRYLLSRPRRLGRGRKKEEEREEKEKEQLFRSFLKGEEVS